MRTFIIRVQEETGASLEAAAPAMPLRGFVDEVATGLRATFRSERELVTALAAAVASRPGPPWTAGQRVPGYGPSPDTTEPTVEET